MITKQTAPLIGYLVHGSTYSTTIVYCFTVPYFRQTLEKLHDIKDLKFYDSF